MQVIELNIEFEKDRIDFNSILDELYNNQEYIDKLKQIYRHNLISVFILKNHERIMSRVSLYAFDKNEKSNTFLFGHFEALDIESGVSILQHLHRKIKAEFNHGTIIGPMNGNSWFNYRIALSNFDLLFKNDITNPAYYLEILVKAGYKVAHHYLTNIQTNVELTQQNTLSDYTIVFFNQEELNQRIIEIYNITMEAFTHAPFFMPIPFSVFEVQFKSQLQLIDLRVSPFVINSTNELCAYCSCYLTNNGESMVVKTIARKQGRQYAGLGRLLSNAIINKANDEKVNAILHAFMHFENSSKSLSERYKGITHKQYGLYQCEL